jgi:hypothetical protein
MARTVKQAPDLLDSVTLALTPPPTNGAGLVPEGDDERCQTDHAHNLQAIMDFSDLHVSDFVERDRGNRHFALRPLIRHDLAGLCFTFWTDL